MSLYRPHAAIAALATLAAALALAAPAATAAGAGYQVYFEPSRVTSTVMEDPHYHHASTVAQFGKRVYVAWNGNLYNAREGQPGQMIMLKSSDDDGVHWGPLQIPFVKEYRALDENAKKGVDAKPGDADDDHKVYYGQAREWQPSLTAFKGKLLMFWNVDRDAAGSALLMSVLEPDGRQWRTNEMHFKPDGTPYFVPLKGGVAPQVSDPSSLSFENAARYTRIPGAEALPASLSLRDVPADLLKVESLNGGRVDPSRIALAGHRLVPSGNQATVLALKDGTPVLAVAVMLQQTRVEWNNVAVKIPGVLTTTDGEHWQLGLVPMRSPAGDLVGGDRGDIGLVAAWEPTVDIDAQGNFHMEFRLLLPPRTAGGGDPAGTGVRTGASIGTYQPGVGVRWSPAHRVDLDVPTTRSMISRIDGQQRWAMVANHLVQGATYDGGGAAPQFRAEHFEPWARENMTVFFSTRGDDDFVAGLNISGKIDEPGVEMVHYPYVQSASVGGSGDDLLIVYSTHRREKSCVGGRGAPAACHDSIRFLRLRDMPDPKRPAIYPNHFARYFGYGQATPQAQTYSVSNNQLTLLDRGSAGIETQGDTGCINLRFKWDGALGANDTRPVLAFGRSADRASPVGLVLRGTGGGAKLMLGDKPVADAARGAWTATRVCYDLARGRLTDGAAVLDLGAGKLDPRSYLGDNTLARRNGRLPDLVIDVAATSLEAGATK